MLNNIMGNGMGNFFQSNQFGQMGFNSNINNIFSQMGSMGNNMNGFFVNNNSNQNNVNNNNQEDNEENYSGSDEEKSEEELQKRYIELRNSVINQLPRFKFNDYKRMNSGKEIHEYQILF